MLKTTIPEVNTNEWADLPADILKQILKHGHDLNTDLTRLRGVCPSWRSALPLQQHSFFRSHIQVPSLRNGIWCNRPLYLLETVFYFFSPLNPCGEEWVARVGQIAPNKWRLLNPLSYDASYNPEVNGNEYFITNPPIVGEINLLDCRAVLLAKALTLVDEVNYNAKPISTKVTGEWDFTLSTQPLSAILVLLAYDYVYRSYSSRLLLLRPNDAQNQENEWTEISLSGHEDKKQNHLVLSDIAYCNGMFFVFQLNGYDSWQVGTVNPSDKASVLKPFASGGRRMCVWTSTLVPSKSKGCLYLVLLPYVGGEQCYCILNEHDGLSVDESKRKITKKLGDEILFCSNYVSFSFQSSTLLNNNILQDKNSMAIFYMFSKHVRFNEFIPEGVKGLNFVKNRRYKKNISLWFTMEKEISEKPVLDFVVGKSIVLLIDVMPKLEKDRVYTRLFFPPPTWVKWRCPSLDNVDINLHNLIDENACDESLWFIYNDKDSDCEEYYDSDYGSSS